MTENQIKRESELGITPVKGLCSNKIKKILEDGGIEVKILTHDREHPQGPYFADAALEVRSTSNNEILNLLRLEPDIKHSKKPGYTYFALHQIDHPTLFIGAWSEAKWGGRITFEEGKLVERTRIYYAK